MELCPGPSSLDLAHLLWPADVWQEQKTQALMWVHVGLHGLVLGCFCTPSGMQFAVRSTL